MHPLKIGVTCWKPESNWDARTLCQQAEHVEALGFHSYWLPENHFEGMAMPSPLTQLAAVSARTTTIKLGTVSYLLPIRHPIQAAEEVAVLDQLCNGRLILGLGRGIQSSVFSAFGIDSKDKRKHFAENLSIMRSAWAGEAITHDPAGKEILPSPLPTTSQGPPLWVAAFGPLALKQVAQLGLPYLASPMETLQELETNYTLFNTLLAESEQGSVSTLPVMRTVFIHEDSRLRARLVDALNQQAAKFRRAESADASEWTIIGDAEYARDKIADYRERLGMIHIIASGRLPQIGTDSLLQSLQCLAKL